MNKTEYIETLRNLLEEVKQACLYGEDDNTTGVTEEPHIPIELFGRICDALNSTPKKIIYTTKDKPYYHYGYISYRIEVDITDPNNVLQRHIWINEIGKTTYDPWIKSCLNGNKEKLERSGFVLKGN